MEHGREVVFMNGRLGLGARFMLRRGFPVVCPQEPTEIRRSGKLDVLRGLEDVIAIEFSDNAELNIGGRSSRRRSLNPSSNLQW